MMPNAVAYIYNSSTQKAEVGESQVPDQSSLDSSILSQKKIRHIKKSILWITYLSNNKTLILALFFFAVDGGLLLK